MARHHGTKHAGKAWRLLLSGVGLSAGAFVTAVAVAAGSAPPAQADFDDLLDPVVQPILTSLTDSMAIFDPVAALDLTSWTDTVLASLGSFDLALPTADSAVAAAATGAEPAAAAAAATSRTCSTITMSTASWASVTFHRSDHQSAGELWRRDGRQSRRQPDHRSQYRYTAPTVVSGTHIDGGVIPFFTTRRTSTTPRTRPTGVR